MIYIFLFIAGSLFTVFGLLMMVCSGINLSCKEKDTQDIIGNIVLMLFGAGVCFGGITLLCYI